MGRFKEFCTFSRLTRLLSEGDMNFIIWINCQIELSIQVVNTHACNLIRKQFISNMTGI